MVRTLTALSFNLLTARVRPSRIASALSSVIQYIKGALAALPYLGFLAPEGSESEERLVRTTYSPLVDLA